MVLINFDEDSEVHPRPIYARSGWVIPQPHPSELEEVQQDLGDVRSETRRLIKLMRPIKQQGLVIRSVPQHIYSCVGVVFANRRAWIDPDKLVKILREDGYTKITDKQKLWVGDVVLYYMLGKPVHVGVVTKIIRSDGATIDVRVLSKWGRVGEVEHNVHNVPEFCGKVDSYWSERVSDDA